MFQSQQPEAAPATFSPVSIHPPRSSVLPWNRLNPVTVDGKDGTDIDLHPKKKTDPTGWLAWHAWMCCWFDITRPPPPQTSRGHYDGNVVQDISGLCPSTRSTSGPPWATRHESGFSDVLYFDPSGQRVEEATGNGLMSFELFWIEVIDLGYIRQHDWVLCVCCFSYLRKDELGISTFLNVLHSAALWGGCK